MPPDDVEVGGGKALFAPVAGRGDDGLVFSNEMLEVFNGFQRHVVFVVPEVHVGSGIGALLRHGQRDGSLVFGLRRRSGLAAAQSKEQRGERKS